jgi:metal-responsive CopG/Arc/MetJ family transcriptional regulator
MKKKYPEHKKKSKITMTIDKNIAKLLELYMLENDIFNKSEFIEKLIREELAKNIEEK